MPGREQRARLRGAVARADGGSLVGLLREGTWPVHALQLIGDGLLDSLAVRIEGAEELALECVDALRKRGWDGDAELADRLSGRLGRGPMPMLRPLAVDLEELAAVLEGDPAHGGGRIDLRTGEVWPQSAIDYAEEVGGDDSGDEDDPDRWLWVECEGSRPSYRDMELFIAELDDSEAADRLSIAIQGRGAFRRFKDVMTRWPHLLDPWYALSEDRQRGRARARLADAGYTTATPPRET